MAFIRIVAFSVDIFREHGVILKPNGTVCMEETE